MSNSGRSDRNGRSPGEANGGDVRQAAERLEQAVEDLVRTAGGAVSGRASRVIDELEQSARKLRDQVADDTAPRRRARVGGGADLRPTRSNGWLRNLYRDRQRGWMGGVCAGLARYFGTEPWVMRIVALSGLVFVPQIIIFGYIACMFLLAPLDRQVMNSSPVRGRAGAGPSAPEFGPYLAPRPALRAMRVEFSDIEQRVRHMEEYVTSREFTLRRELDALEPGPAGR